MLIKFGAELGFYGITTPFHCAARRGHTALCSYLLDQGIDPNVCEVGGGTSLYLAAKNGHAEVVSLLLSRKVDVTVFGDEKKDLLFSSLRKVVMSKLFSYSCSTDQISTNG